MDLVEILLALIAACIGFALLARRLALPYAVILVLGGMVLAFIPGLPEVRLNPELALAFFLPPLLQASAYRTDWRAFRSNLAADPGCWPSARCCSPPSASPASAAAAAGPALVGRRSRSAPSSRRRMRWRPTRCCNGCACRSASSPCWRARAWSTTPRRWCCTSWRSPRRWPAPASCRPRARSPSSPSAPGASASAGWSGWLRSRCFRRLDDTMLEITTSFLAAYAAYLAGGGGRRSRA